ncbi:hypothetical protein FOA52_010541 [Chlamydomonas sp. UWO 241]|nr:hypothetical protein FOA52_010541 [Chlamydomonas sp. UWO 241]
MRGCIGQRSACSSGVRSGGVRRLQRSVHVAAGKGAQKNQGMYFEYERVGGAAEEEALLREAEARPEEFNWAKQARQEAYSHRRRRESTKLPGRAQGGGGGGRGAGRTPPPPKQEPEQQQQQQQQAVSAAAAVPSTPPATSRADALVPAPAPALVAKAVPAPPPPPPLLVAKAVAAQGVPSTERIAIVAAPGASAAIYSRKQRLMERMQTGAAVAAAAAVAPAAAAVVAAPRHPLPDSVKQLVEESDEAGGELLAALPDVPDLGPLDDEEAGVADLLRSHFVDVLGGEQEASSAPGQGMAVAVQSEVAAQREFERWVRELRSGGGGGAGDQLDDSEIEALEALAERMGDGEDEDEDDGLNEEAGPGGIGSADAPDVAAMLKAATAELADFRELAALLSAEDASLGLTGGADEDDSEVGAEEPEERVLARLRASDPDLFQLLSSVPGGRDDDDLLASFFSASSSPAAGPSGRRAPEDEVSDAEVQELLRSGASDLQNDDADFLGGGDDDDDSEGGDAEGEGSMADLFDAIDEDDEMDEQEKMRATMELQGIFNAPAAEEAAAAMAKKKALAPPLDPAARGRTTTGTHGGAADHVPPPMLARPALRRQ